MSAGDLYATDFIGWTEQQARLLREAGAQGTNLPFDWRNLAEEVEGLGISHAHAVSSQIARIIEHLLKLEFSPAVDPRGGWIDSIDDARAEIELLLTEDPGLKPRLSAMLQKAEPIAARRAARALLRHGEETAAALVRTQGVGRYTLEQTTGDWLPERPELAQPGGAA